MPNCATSSPSFSRSTGTGVAPLAPPSPPKVPTKNPHLRDQLAVLLAQHGVGREQAVGDALHEAQAQLLLQLRALVALAVWRVVHGVRVCL